MSNVEGGIDNNHSNDEEKEPQMPPAHSDGSNTPEQAHADHVQEQGREEIIITPLHSEENTEEEQDAAGAEVRAQIEITPREIDEQSPDHNRNGPIHELPEHESRDDFVLGIFDRREYIGIRPLTIDDIASNPMHQQLFAEFFETHAPGRMDIHARAMARGAITSEERVLLNHAQYEYTKLIQTWERLKPMLTPAFMEEIAARDEKFRICAVDLRGPQKTMQAILRIVPHIAMKDRDAFYMFAEAAHSLKENRATWHARNYTNRVLKQCARNGIDPRDYETFFNIGDETSENRQETLSRIRAHYREHYGRFRKSVDDALSSLGWGTAMSARYNLFTARFKNRESATASVLQDINRNLNEITSFLAPAVTDNPVIVEALTCGAYTGEDISFPQEHGPRSFSEIHLKDLEERVLSQARMEERFNALKSEARTPDGRAWDDMNSDERRAVRDSMPPPPEVARSGLGLWAWIKHLLGMAIFRKRRDALLLT